MAYAAVTSLMGTLHQHFLQLEPHLPLKHKQEVVSLYENLGFVQEILETATDDAVMKDVEAEIRDVSLKAEERIEMELTEIYIAKSKRLCITGFRLRLDTIFNEAVEQTNCLKNELIRVKRESQNERLTDFSTSSQSVSKFSKNASKFESRVVGCEEEFTRILDQLTPQSARRQVVSIVGMGGIGKTTLALRVYEDPSITCHFDKRAWITVSQEYNVGQMLRCLVDCVCASSDEVHDHDQLAESVYKRLKGQRYLIVIDDIWSATAWDSVQRCFPDDDNGSRILLTSRLREVAEYASSGNSPLNIRFLDADESWNLYCQVFGKTEFDFVFEQIGREIVKKCKGLPLAIIVVAGLLSKTGEMVEKWRNIAENVSSYVIGDSDEVCSRILSLSYNQLPHYLKACFLYFRVFPEDYEIPVKKLVKLWAAEGFFRVPKHWNPEELAMEYLQDLVDRSLVLVSKQSFNGKIKTIRIHDLLRDLCFREARRENLLNVIGNDYHDGFVGLEKLSLYMWKSQHLLICNLLSVIEDDYHDDFLDLSIKVFSHFKLLRVVDMELKDYKGGVKVLSFLENLVHLRYLALSKVGYRASFHVKLCEHWNMQSFIVRGCGGILVSSQASGIWKMPLLRNFCVDGILSLVTPTVVNRNLETISWLDPKCCTTDLFTKIPNLKKLGIQARLSSENPDYFYSLVHLGKLGKLSIRDNRLKCIPCSGIPWGTSFLPNLKKLNFLWTGLPWSDMSLVGMLPNLEVLKLIDACKGEMWEPSEGGFRRLKRLVIKETDLDCWNAVGDHFPVLECLELNDCNFLREIPSGFAYITTLGLIQLNYCWDSLLASAKWIQDEQHNYGNHALLVCSKNIWFLDEEGNISLKECFMERLFNELQKNHEKTLTTLKGTDE